jgi:hypothetical protein
MPVTATHLAPAFHLNLYRHDRDDCDTIFRDRTVQARALAVM